MWMYVCKQPNHCNLNKWQMPTTLAAGGCAPLNGDGDPGDVGSSISSVPRNSRLESTDHWTERRHSDLTLHADVR